MLDQVLYSYLVEHDYGLAPNPFGKYCTLAVCKPAIRGSSKIKVRDWVIGTGSKALEKVSGKSFQFRLIYAMEISEIVTIQEYWDDSRFAYKKPITNGSLISIYGDNFYHKDDMGNWIQEDSAHSNIDGSPNHKHLKKDTDGKNVLVAEKFYYFGEGAPVIPELYKGLCHSGVGQKKISDETSSDFIQWVVSNYKEGIHGDPINWKEYDQLNFF